MLSFLPAALLTAHQFLWEQRSVSGHQLPCPCLQGTPRLPQPTPVQPQAQPCHAQGCLPGAAGASLLRFRGSCSAQEGCEVPLVLFSTSPCTPILVFNVYITAETGKNTRCVQAGLLPLFRTSLCELPDGQKRPPASPHGLLQPAALRSAIYQAPTAALSPFKFTLHLLVSQPAFSFAAFRNLGSKGYLRFANLE